jgi:phosphomannomutase
MLIMIPQHVFRAYDIRGVYGVDFDAELFLRIGRVLRGQKVSVAHDTRTTSPLLASALKAGLLEAGKEVLDVGMVPFGVAVFAGVQERVDTAAFVTASHLPPEWNGLKLYHNDGNGFEEDEIMEVARLLETAKPPTRWETAKAPVEMDYVNKYIEFLAKKFKITGITAAVDCGGGSTAIAVPRLFDALGMKGPRIFCDVDPFFRGRSSEPTHDNVSKLRNEVIGYDFGVAFDGDGDRAMVVDDKGRVVPPDTVGILLGKALMHKRKGTILANVECSMAVEDVLTPLGATVKRIPVGHTFLTQYAKKYKALLGMESSGHFVLPDYYLFDDAVLVPLKIAELLSETDKPLSAMVDEIPAYPRQKTTIPCADDRKFGVIEKLKERFINEYHRVDALDGVRVDLPNGWCLVRASNTEPKIRVTCEGKTEEDVRKILDEFSGALKEEMIARDGGTKAEK